MKTITIFELLGMVKDGKAPEKIKYNGIEWEYTVGNQYRRLDKKNLGNIWNGYNFNILNDEVEILEEEPRDINVCGSWLTKSEYDEYLKGEEEKKIPEKLGINDINTLDLFTKVNEIIDTLEMLNAKIK